MADAIETLKLERKELQSRIERIDRALAVLGAGITRRGSKRTFSSETRERMAAAARKRWAKAKGKGLKKL